MKQPLFVTAAIITDDDKILLIKRAREPFKDCWAFIGGSGSFEKHNDPIDAVKNEVAGDINCKFEPKFFKYNCATFEVPTITLFFHGKIEGTPKITPKYVTEYRWFTIKEAKELKLAFDHNGILKEFAGN